MQERHLIRGEIHTAVKNLLETKELAGNFDSKSKQKIFSVTKSGCSYIASDL